MIEGNARWRCAIAPLFVLIVGACTNELPAQAPSPFVQRAAGPLVQSGAGTEPGCDGTLMVEKCWMRLADRNGCRVWREEPLAGRASVTWSGDCRNGKAHGDGTLTIAWHNLWHRGAESVQEGELDDGKKTGNWVLRHSFLIEEGEYKAGRRMGTWEISGPNGWAFTERYMAWGPIVD